ncbi:4088_t:CDS:1 [Paraglomus brasilianum]|uniref:4088_t:CDS:1 n=1 Tax=Paraglomus brasilianum TaxID=144538 RepID=A0A9N9BLD5_9GLOM|nr:4088_t:CDS:1 [Paraglomus brasilianum]
MGSRKRRRTVSSLIPHPVVTRPATCPSSITRAFNLPPECIIKILQYLQASSLHSCRDIGAEAKYRQHDQDDIKSLRSCMLVNRTWCKLVVSILWRRPFNYQPMKTGRWLIDMYLRFLSPEQRKYLGIKLLDKSTPLFDYPSYLRELHYQELYIAIFDWEKSHYKSEIEFEKRVDEWSSKTRSHKEIANYFPISKIGVEIAKMFLSKCSTFDLLCLGTSRIEYKWNEVQAAHVALPTFPGARKALSQLWGFVCSGDYEKREIFESMSEYCREISVLTADGLFEREEGVHEALSTLIQSQRKLEIFILCRCFNTFKVLPSLDSQQRTLRYLQFTECHFMGADPLLVLQNNDNAVRQLEFVDCKFFACVKPRDKINCRQLETLKFSKCTSINGIVDGFTNCKFPQLSALEIADTVCDAAPLYEVLKNAGSSLRELKILSVKGIGSGTTLIEHLARHCPNLVVLHLALQHEALNKLCILFRATKNLVEMVIDRGTDVRVAHDMSSVLSSLGADVPASLRVLSIGTHCAFQIQAVKVFLGQCKAQMKSLTLYSYGGEDENKAVITGYAGRRKFKIKKALHNQSTVAKLSVDFD